MAEGEEYRQAGVVLERSEMDYAVRQRRLADRLSESGFDALLVTHLPNIYYLCGFQGSAGVLLFQADGQAPRLTFYTDGRYTQQAAEQVKGAKVVINKRAALIEACQRVQKLGLKRLAVESEHLPFAAYRQISG